MSATLQPGTRLGRYEIKSQIGAGGMGEVYRARDPRLGRDVAIKVLPAAFSSDVERLTRFKQEARAASTLSHPYVAHIYEIGEADGYSFISMEYVEGETLRQTCAREPMKLSEALNVVVQTAAALAAAHQAGIVHRDIKPENIMLRHDGYVKVLDFGLAKLSEQSGHSLDPDTLAQSQFKTDPGVVLGTMTYMSPEQARGLAVDARTDIWSLGVVLYEVVSGRTPFAGATGSDVIASILTAEPAEAARSMAEVPDELWRVLRKALHKDTGQRYQTAAEMLADLQSVKRRLEFETELKRSADVPSPPEPPGFTRQQPGTTTTAGDISSPPELPAMHSGESQSCALEIAHVLFMDVVGYSRLPMSQQTTVLRQLV
ncbi:MAG: serine/threonine protein kinase, partial [Acidobacteria bacterium]|nr:serine/threonine protein kinase [Acidobacteriota bacterium]